MTAASPCFPVPVTLVMDAACPLVRVAPIIRAALAAVAVMFVVVAHRHIVGQHPEAVWAVGGMAGGRGDSCARRLAGCAGGVRVRGWAVRTAAATLDVAGVRGEAWGPEKGEA